MGSISGLYGPGRCERRVLGDIAMQIGLTAYSGWARATGCARTWIAKSPQSMATIERIGGDYLIGVGASISI